MFMECDRKVIKRSDCGAMADWITARFIAFGVVGDVAYEIQFDAVADTYTLLSFERTPDEVRPG